MKQTAIDQLRKEIRIQKEIVDTYQKESTYTERSISSRAIDLKGALEAELVIEAIGWAEAANYPNNEIIEMIKVDLNRTIKSLITLRPWEIRSTSEIVNMREQAKASAWARVIMVYSNIIGESVDYKLPLDIMFV